MTVRALIDALTQRGIKLRLDGDRVRGRGLTQDERTFLRDPPNARAVAALLTFHTILATESTDNERAAQRLSEESLRFTREERRKERLAVMATWEPVRVLALAEAGKLSAEDIKVWWAVRQELERRAAWAARAQMFSAITGRSVTVRFRDR